MKSPITQRGCNRYLLELKELAQENRSNPTKAETIVWQELKKRHFGYKFLRQKPISRFILDFYCAKLLLAIEIDGDSHDSKVNYDLGRDQILGNIGIKTIRYTNDYIKNKLADFEKDLKINIYDRQQELGLAPLLKGRCR